MSVALPALTSLLALLFSLALFDQWLERRHAFQLVWALGMLFYAIAAGCEAVAAVGSWNEALYRVWYLTGAVWTAGWLGLGTAFLLGRTRFGYTFAILLVLAGMITIATQAKYHYPGAGIAPILYVITALILAVAVGVETYFQDQRWPILAAVAVVGATVLSIVLNFTTTLPAPGYAIDPATGVPSPELLPGTLRLLTPFLNFTGGLALLLGALFSAYVFMPKQRVLAYSLDPNQPGDQFLFNLLIAPVAITVNFVRSLPGAVRALLTGNIHSRVPATILIAIGAFVPIVSDSFSRYGQPEFRAVGHLVGVVFLFAGFLVSIEVFREIRVPFTGIVIRARRRERDTALDAAGEGSAGKLADGRAEE
ncbi:MAG TPA: hypothetical protein VNF73_09850 [Candidatus Saccharimonadales bacterium]|nr:hypothetical protein [Candidatus Saccharimonadales bacterium]